MAPEERAQKMAALDMANAIRIGRAQVRREIESGEQDLVELILDPPECVVGAKIGTILKWAPRMGASKATRMLRGVVFSTDIPLEHLGQATREKIVERYQAWQEQLKRNQRTYESRDSRVAA